ncbi:MAG: sigma 54-interacting transcriptional regulator [Deltaproteobacteria bacterium]|nr:sigma 54-interacting transcriptional regulator [Deltaproteobacteria bacterium]
MPVGPRSPVVLFLCSRSNGLQLIAEGLARCSAGDAVSVVSASLGPADLHPAAARVMDEIGVPIADVPLRTPLDIDVFDSDLVVTLGDFDPACRPSLPGMPPHLHWDLPDPPADCPEPRLLAGLRAARDELRARVAQLFASGALPAMVTARRNIELVVEALDEGLAARTIDGRIFYFNRAAERITGLARAEVVGQDWREILVRVGLDTNGEDGVGDGAASEVAFTRPDGERRVVKMAALPLLDATGARGGTLVSLQDRTELHSLRRRLKHHHALEGMVGKDPKMLLLFDLIREVAPVNVPVLVQGESGTGKELVARAIHALSPRRDRPFVAVNCGALPEGILESELFGHVRGAFSGAVASKRGRFELADGGTLFLDEVAELSPRMQVKLLRVLQEQRFERVGGEAPVQVDVRVLSATNQDLRRLMERRRLRRDLYYRLCVIPIVVPPLRDRKLDVPMLVEHFVEVISRQTGRPMLIPSTETLDVLTRYPWPGNVRELRNVLEFAYVKCRGGTIGPEHLPAEVRAHEHRAHGRAPRVRKEALLAAQTAAPAARARRRSGTSR